MCGIAGCWDRRPAGARASDDELRGHVAAMRDALVHRGPDDAGIFTDTGAGVALGSRRLAVIDLSEHGHQPMASPDGRYVLAFNGEIYNYRQLRADLERAGHRFGGSSDTEVLVHAVQRWGLRRALERSNGMFALALWDGAERRLQLARDRFGEKPLYYGWSGGVLVFGSELKALRAHPAFSGEVDRDVVALYLRHNCVPAPYSIYRGVAKLLPGSIVTMGEASPPGTPPALERYWSMAEVAAAGEAGKSAASPEEAMDQLDAVLRGAVAARMHADVAIGAFLSGGIDSSLVVALMAAQDTASVKTFTIAFDDAGYDEATHAKAVAAHLGTDHHELHVTPAETLALIPSLPAIYDEPFADSSQVPTAILARLTRRHVTVALSGDGGDELFGGYNRYVWAERFWGRIAPVPRPLRAAAGAALGAVPPRFWDGAFATAGRVLPRAAALRMPATKLAKAASVMAARDLHDTYRTLSSHTTDPAALVPGAAEPVTVLSDPGAWPRLGDPVELMMYLDAVTYLPDDILTKVDRATMAASLEARVPFLDPDVAALAWRLPRALKVHGGTGKWLLRRLLHRYVPAPLVERPKAGFGVPIGDWLRGPLREWAEDLLAERHLREAGILDPVGVRRMWAEHASGRRDRQFELWDVLMLQAWLADAS